MEAGDGDYGEEQERLSVSKLAAGDVGWDDDEGKVWHHICFIHLDQCLRPLKRDNIFVDDIAIGIAGEDETATAESSGSDCWTIGSGRVFVGGGGLALAVREPVFVWCGVSIGVLSTAGCWTRTSRALLNCRVFELVGTRKAFLIVRTCPVSYYNQFQTAFLTCHIHLVAECGRI